MVHQLQETIGELEEQLNFAIDQRKEEEQGTMIEKLYKHDYALATSRLSQEIEKLKFEKEYMKYLAHSMRNLRPLRILILYS